MNRSLNEKWSELCQKVCTYPDVDRSQFNAFAERMSPQLMSEGYALITVENSFLKKRVEQNILPFIERALEEIYGTSFLVEVDINPDQEADHAKQASQASAPSTVGFSPNIESPKAVASSAIPTSPSAKDFNEVTEEAVVEASYEPASVPPPVKDQATETQSSGKTFTSLTFENFVIGESNRMAYSMALQVAEFPGKSPLNPLFIHGKSGLGKTHLMRAIQNYINVTRPELVTVYEDSEELVNRYTEASLTRDINKSSYNNFKSYYESADVLLIDDVQFLRGKTGTLDIFFQMFNKLINQGKQIVLSADRAPKNIDVDERYKTRFMQGGVIDIQPPEIETKLAIVRLYINEYKATDHMHDFFIPEDVQMYIAENSGSNIRELKSAVTKIVYTVIFENLQSINVEQVKVLLENHFTRGTAKYLTIEDIQKVVEDFYKIKHSDMVGSSRSREVVFPRQIAMYLCKLMLDNTLNNIGEKFNKNHSTVIHSIKLVEEKMLSNRDLQEEVEILKKNINNL